MNRDTIGDRIRNMTRDAIKSADPTYKGLVGAGGAISYALLELTESIRRATDQRELLNHADMLAEVVMNDVSESDYAISEETEALAKSYIAKREGSEADQLLGMW
jgi:hypothetical protein